MDPHALKSLQVRKTQLESELRVLSKTLHETQKTISVKNKSLYNVNRELEALSNRQPSVSEHALLRYIERVMHIDLKQIEKEILTPEVVKAIDVLSSGKIPLGDNLLIVKNKTVTSIIPKDQENEKPCETEQTPFPCVAS
jgi:hypothetical protein